MSAVPKKAATADRQADEQAKTQYLYWWLMLAILFEYTRPGNHFSPLGVLPLNSAIPLTLFVWSFFAKGLRPWKEVFADPMAKWPFVLVGFVLLSLLYADVQTYAYNVFIRVLGYLLLFIMIARIITNERRVRGLIATLIVCHLFLLAMNPQVVLNPSVRQYLVGGTFLGDGNDFSLSLTILIPLTVELALSAKSRLRQLGTWMVVLLLMLAIVASQSRGATVGVAAVFGYLWLRSTRKGLTLVAIAVAVLVALAYAPDAYFSRMSTISTYQEESSAQSRIDAWRAGVKMASSNALGVGAGNFPNSFRKYRPSDATATAAGRYMTAHSMYFLILGELGFLGLLLLLKMLIGNMRTNTALRRRLLSDDNPSPQAARDARALYMTSASVLGLAVAGAFLSVTYYPHLFVLTGLLVAQRALAARNAGLSVVPEKVTAASRRATAVKKAGSAGPAR